MCSTNNLYFHCHFQLDQTSKYKCDKFNKATEFFHLKALYKRHMQKIAAIIEKPECKIFCFSLSL